MENSIKYIKFNTEDEKKALLDEVIAYFETQRGEKIGYIAAEEILEFFLENVGKKIYNKTINDIQKILSDKTQDIVIELETLKES